MQKQKYIISIKGSYGTDEGTDGIELTTIGNYYKRRGKYYVAYDESFMTGMEGTTTTLEIDGQKQVILKRSGTNRSQFIIENGKRYLCSYETEFGNTVFGVYSHYIRNSLSGSGGDIAFKYSLDVNASLTSVNEVHIKIKECEKHD
ncbi:MAG: DUF1934 domain-containing protein [Oscillospiraceae bacterium]|nr:DUF1934 domain-containing protein [Oscillospiraceae bacterium]